MCNCQCRQFIWGKYSNTLFCYKTYHHVADISCSNISSEIHCSSRLGRCTWKQHTTGVSVHKNSTLKFLARFSYWNCQKQMFKRHKKKKNSLSSQAEYFHSDIDNIYVVYCHNWFITLTAIRIRIYICILKPCFLNICFYNWYGQANKEENCFFNLVV